MIIKNFPGCVAAVLSCYRCIFLYLQELHAGFSLSLADGLMLLGPGSAGAEMLEEPWGSFSCCRGCAAPFAASQSSSPSIVIPTRQTERHSLSKQWPGQQLAGVYTELLSQHCTQQVGNSPWEHLGLSDGAQQCPHCTPSTMPLGSSSDGCSADPQGCGVGVCDPGGRGFLSKTLQCHSR